MLVHQVTIVQEEFIISHNSVKLEVGDLLCMAGRMHGRVFHMLLRWSEDCRLNVIDEVFLTDVELQTITVSGSHLGWRQ